MGTGWDTVGIVPYCVWLLILFIITEALTTCVLRISRVCLLIIIIEALTTCVLNHLWNICYLCIFFTLEPDVITCNIMNIYKFLWIVIICESHVYVYVSHALKHWHMIQCYGLLCVLSWETQISCVCSCRWSEGQGRDTIALFSLMWQDKPSTPYSLHMREHIQVPGDTFTTSHAFLC